MYKPLNSNKVHSTTAKEREKKEKKSHQMQASLNESEGHLGKNPNKPEITHIKHVMRDLVYISIKICN